MPLPPPLVTEPTICGAVGLAGLDVRCACAAGGQVVLGTADGTLRVYGAPDAEAGSPASEAGALELRRWLRCANGGAPSSVSWLPSVDGVVTIQPWLSRGGLLRAAVVYPRCLVADGCSSHAPPRAADGTPVAAPADDDHPLVPPSSASELRVHCSPMPRVIDLPDAFPPRAVASAGAQPAWHVTVCDDDADALNAQFADDGPSPVAPAIALPTGGEATDVDADYKRADEFDGERAPRRGAAGGGGGGTVGVDVLCAAACELSGRVAIGCDGRLLVFRLWLGEQAHSHGRVASSTAPPGIFGTLPMHGVGADGWGGMRSVCVQLLCAVELRLTPRCVSACGGTVAVASSSEVLALQVRAPSEAEVQAPAVAMAATGGPLTSGDDGSDDEATIVREAAAAAAREDEDDDRIWQPRRGDAVTIEGWASARGDTVANACIDVSDDGDEDEASDFDAASSAYWSDGVDELTDESTMLDTDPTLPSAHARAAALSDERQALCLIATAAADSDDARDEKVLVSERKMVAGYSASMQMVLTLPRTPSQLLTRIPFHEPWSSEQPGRTLPAAEQRRTLLRQPRALRACVPGDVTSMEDNRDYVPPTASDDGDGDEDDDDRSNGIDAMPVAAAHPAAAIDGPCLSKWHPATEAPPAPSTNGSQLLPEAPIGTAVWASLAPAGRVRWLLHERFGARAGVHTVHLLAQRPDLPPDPRADVLARQLVSGFGHAPTADGSAEPLPSAAAASSAASAAPLEPRVGEEQLPSMLVCGVDEGFLVALGSGDGDESGVPDPTEIAAREPLARYAFSASGVPARMCAVDAPGGLLISLGADKLQLWPLRAGLADAHHLGSAAADLAARTTLPSGFPQPLTPPVPPPVPLLTWRLPTAAGPPLALAPIPNGGLALLLPPPKPKSPTAKSPTPTSPAHLRRGSSTEGAANVAEARPASRGGDTADAGDRGADGHGGASQTERQQQAGGGGEFDVHAVGGGKLPAASTEIAAAKATSQEVEQPMDAESANLVAGTGSSGGRRAAMAGPTAPVAPSTAAPVDVHGGTGAADIAHEPAIAPAPGQSEPLTALPIGGAAAVDVSPTTPKMSDVLAEAMAAADAAAMAAKAAEMAASGWKAPSSPPPPPRLLPGLSRMGRNASYAGSMHSLRGVMSADDLSLLGGDSVPPEVELLSCIRRQVVHRPSDLPPRDESGELLSCVLHFVHVGGAIEHAQALMRRANHVPKSTAASGEQRPLSPPPAAVAQRNAKGKGEADAAQEAMESVEAAALEAAKAEPDAAVRAAVGGAQGSGSDAGGGLATPAASHHTTEAISTQSTQPTQPPAAAADTAPLQLMLSVPRPSTLFSSLLSSADEATSSAGFAGGDGDGGSWIGSMLGSLSLFERGAIECSTDVAVPAGDDAGTELQGDAAPGSSTARRLSGEHAESGEAGSGTGGGAAATERRQAESVPPPPAPVAQSALAAASAPAAASAAVDDEDATAATDNAVPTPAPPATTTPVALVPPSEVPTERRAPPPATTPPADWSSWSAAQLRCQAVLLLLSALAALPATPPAKTRIVLRALALEAAAQNVVQPASRRASERAERGAPRLATAMAAHASEDAPTPEHAADEAEVARPTERNVDRVARLWYALRLGCAAIGSTALPALASKARHLGAPAASALLEASARPLGMLMLAGGAPLHAMLAPTDALGTESGQAGRSSPLAHVTSTSAASSSSSSLAAATRHSPSPLESVQARLGVSAIELLLYPQLGEPLLPSVMRVPPHAARRLGEATLAQLASHGAPDSLPRALISSDLARLPVDERTALRCLQQQPSLELPGGASHGTTLDAPAAATDDGAITTAPRRLFATFSPMLHAALAMVALSCRESRTAADALEALPPRTLLQLARAHPYLLLNGEGAPPQPGRSKPAAAHKSRPRRSQGERPTCLARLLAALAPYALCDCLVSLVRAGRVSPLAASRVAYAAAGSRPHAARLLQLGVLWKWLLDASARVMTRGAVGQSADSGATAADARALISRRTSRAHAAVASFHHMRRTAAAEAPTPPVPASATASVAVDAAAFGRCAHEFVAALVAALAGDSGNPDANDASPHDADDVCIAAAIDALSDSWHAQAGACESGAAEAVMPTPVLIRWLEAALTSPAPPRVAADEIGDETVADPLSHPPPSEHGAFAWARQPPPRRSPMHEPRRALCVGICAAITQRAVCAGTSHRAWLLADGWLRRALAAVNALDARTAAAAWPATVLGAPTAADSIRLLAPAAPAAAFAYVLVAHPAADCEHSSAARAAWARLVIALNHGAPMDARHAADAEGVTRLREAAIGQLADALPPPSLFAVLAAAEAAVRPAVSDVLQRRSVAAQAARALRQVVGALAADAATSSWERAEAALEAAAGGVGEVDDIVS